MKLENIGDITLMTNEDGREFYVPGHVEGRLILQATEQHEKDVAPRAILTGTKKEMNEAGAHLYNGEVSIVQTDRFKRLLLELEKRGTLMPEKDIKKPKAIMEAEASVALDGDTHSAHDFPHVAFWGLCEEHLKHAREKHHFFADSVGAKGAPNDWYEELALKRKCLIQSAPHLENVLMGEVYEFLAEMAKGDLDRAREEGADIVAVLLRALEGDVREETE